MITIWRSIAPRWAALFLAISLAGSLTALFQGTSDQREWFRYVLTLAFAIVWHMIVSVRSRKQRNAP
jgi:hypothetical protein